VCGLLLSLVRADRGFALDPARNLTQYNCQTWTRHNGLPASSVNAIVQTRDGYLWFGTAAGLLRFDGTEFKLIDLHSVDNLRNSHVTSLAESRSGGLWVGLENSSFGFYDGRLFSWRGEKTAALDVRSVLEDKDGTLWLGAEQQAARLNRSGELEAVQAPDASTNSFTEVYCCHEDRQGRIWFGTANQGVYCWQDGKVTKLPDPKLDATIVVCITEDWDGQIWVGTRDGLFCYGSDLKRRENPTLATRVNCLLVDRQGVLWIGTGYLGLIRYQNGKYAFLQKADGLASDSVRAIAEDHEGSLWVGTDVGISQISDVKFPIQPATDQPTITDANSVTVARDGGVWIASYGGVTRYNPQTEVFTTPPGLPTNYTKRVLEARNGDLYCVCGTHHLVIVSGGKTVAEYVATNQIVGMAEDEQGVVVSVGGELYRADTNYFQPYTFKHDVEPPQFYWILNLASGTDGVIWVACGNGIFRVKDGDWRRWSEAEGLSDSHVETICEDQDGVVWAGLHSGIARLKDNQIRLIDRKNGLFDNDICAIVPDNLGNLWVDSSRGISRVARRSINDFCDGKISQMDSTAFDGLRSVKTTDKTAQERVGCKTADGRIWFPGPRGVVMIDPAHISTNPAAPPVHIEDVLANGQEFARSEATVVPPGKGELEFHYNAPSFVEPQAVQFRYRLEGYDKDWVDAGNRRLAFYTNLKPGRYAFRVIAANADGVWNRQGDTLTVELRPHFYQAGWFDLVGGGLLLAALAGGYLGRIRHHVHKEKKYLAARVRLEAEVNRRTAELAYERDLLRELLENTPDKIYFKDAQSRFMKSSNAQARLLGLATSDELIGKSDFDIFSDEHARPAFEDEQKIIRTGQPMIGKIEKESWKDGRGESWALTTKMPFRNKAGEIIGTFGISKDITDIKHAEARLKEAHQQLLETSRLAGMAEVATNVLHNIGNVLNSVNVSASLVLDKTKESKIPYLAKVVALLNEHAADLGGFITTDAKGRQVPGYLSQLAGQLAQEQLDTIRELELLRQNIEHIKDVVAMQQSYAKISGVTETVKVADLVEDALRMNAGALARHEVELVRAYADVPPVTVEKHKVLQILVNLIRNAKYACDDSGRKDKLLRIQISQTGGGVQIAVLDNGIGIPPENLAHIFNHGFTTRKGGHGFGLHSGALAARDLGGSLTAHSEGTGQGARFNLELPLQPPKADL